MLVLAPPKKRRYRFDTKLVKSMQCMFTHALMQVNPFELCNEHARNCNNVLNPFEHTRNCCQCALSTRGCS